VGWVDSGWSILQTVSSATQLIGFISQVVESKCYVRSVDTQDQRDLVGVYDYLLGNETCDSFEDSGEAVAAFEAAEILVRSAKYHTTADPTQVCIVRDVPLQYSLQRPLRHACRSRAGNSAPRRFGTAGNLRSARRAGRV